MVPPSITAIPGPGAAAAAAACTAAPCAAGRILHLLHTLPVQAVLLDVPADARLGGHPLTGLSSAVAGSSMAGSASVSGASSRRHSRASTHNAVLPTLAHAAPIITDAPAAAAAAATAAAGVKASALVAALGEIQAQQLRDQQHRARAANASANPPALRLLPTSASASTSSPAPGSGVSSAGATHGGSTSALNDSPDNASADPAAAAAAISPATPPTPRWALAPRRGHSALYAGIQSLAHKAAASPDACDAASAPTDPASTASAATGPFHESVYIGTLGPIVDSHGRIVEQYELSAADRAELADLLWREQRCIPVLVDDDTASKHYSGYCKSTLWPLFHYILWDGATDGRRELLDWAAYERVNLAFAQVAAEHYDPQGDLIWVHDYHLLLAPSLLRAELARVHGEETAHLAAIGLFIHTPFPSSEVFRCLPKRTPLLEGILGASLVGFQTYSYCRHFVSCCTRVLGLESSPTGIDFHGHHVAVGIFPIGIDAQRTEVKRRAPAVAEKAAALRDMYAGKRIVVGRDKLDQMRGVHQKLKAFGQFLETYPEWRGKVVLIQVTSPTTTGGQLVLPGDAGGGGGGGASIAASSGSGGSGGSAGIGGGLSAAKLEAKVSELVANINGKYGSLDFQPVHHIHRAIAPDEYYALLTAADAGLITSVRDGMNTTSHEFVVCQQEHMAPLILSEFTGTAGSLSGAMLVNPWDFAGVAAALHDALTIPREEKFARHHQMMDHVARYTAPQWARSFARALVGTRARLQSGAGGALDAHTTPYLHRERCLAEYRASVADLGGEDGALRPMRLILFDYDGTLSPIVKVPEMARPTPELLEALAALCADPANRVFVISGRDQATLDAWVGHIDGLGLSAEHGSFLKYPYDARGWLDLTEEHGDDPAVWKPEVVDIFNFYTERTPGSFIEHKRCSVTWHYRLADPSFGAFQARECQNHLENSTLSKRPLEILVGKKNLEVRPIAVNKGEIVKRLLATAAPPGARFEYVFCVGDDRTDEDMFRALHQSAAEAAAAVAAGSVDGGEGEAKADEVLLLGHQLDAAAPTTTAAPTASASASAATSPTTGEHGAARDRYHPRHAWTVTVGSSTKRTLADWHVQSPHHVVDVMREWAGLPRVASASGMAAGASPVPSPAFGRAASPTSALAGAEAEYEAEED
ncbi:hypothetical protein H9P43_005986 [Blastocladiella emersonii ATCC 22665]|nr:hypothetical protein H9P43_005986 [Blastocladiella emersonii ATCC 22665]